MSLALPTSATTLLRTLEERRAGYVAGWRPKPGGAGRAILAVLAHYAGLVDDALQHAPERHRLAFLDAMGTTLLPPRPARAPLVFTLAADAPLDVPLPEGSEAAVIPPPPLPTTLAEEAALAPTAPPEPIVFATDAAITLVRARLASLLSVVPALDAWRDHAGDASAGFGLFDDLELVPHHLYLAHDTYFDLKGSAEIALLTSVGGSNTAAGPVAAVALQWEYLTAEGWLPFEPVIDQTSGLRADGEILLRKVCGPGLSKAVVDGVESFWIRARVVEPLPLPGSPGGEADLPRIDTVRAIVRLRQEGLPLDVAFADGLPVDASKDFLPLGPEPRVGSTFLLACDEAFKRPGARIELAVLPSTANFAEANPARALTFEYSIADGRWRVLLADADEQLQKGTTVRRTSFARPDDWGQAEIAGERHYWLRVRLTEGSYGGPTKYTIAGDSVTQTDAPKPPVLALLTVAYSYETTPQVLDHCRALNEFVFEDCTSALRWGREGFQPFKALADQQPAVYLGFDGRLPVGLVSLYAQSAERLAAGTAAPASPFTWEYRSPAGWSELAVLDETGGFRLSGLLQFVGPADLIGAPGPGGREIFWVRGRMKTGTATPEPLPLEALRANAVWASNRRAVRAEVLGRSDGSPQPTLAVQHPPVLPGERLEVREWQGAGSDWESLLRDVPAARLRTERDARGNVTAVWVRWEERPHLYSSAAGDRHYTLERTTGFVRFGDGASGLIPPAGAPIAVSYDFGGGPAGNVAAASIAQLHSAVPYVERVENPLAASGGAPAEQTGEVRAFAEAQGNDDEPGPGGVRARGAQRLRHRDRALAASDYEWLARDASAEVAVVRCLPATDADGPRRPGFVTLVVAPWSSEPQPQPSEQLMRRVRDHLARRAPAAVARGVRVVGPTYRPVSVIADITVAEPERASEVEEAVRRALDAFLHPLTGGAGGAGWRFGEDVHLSQVAAELEATPFVAFASEIQLAADGAVHPHRIPVEPGRLVASGRHLLRLRLEA